MVQVVWDSLPPSPGTLTPPSNASGAASPYEHTQGSRLKGRRRIFQSLQRISSSPSLVRLGRASSSTNVAGTGNSKASMSCVSLSSSSGSRAYGHSCSSSLQSNQAFSTAPTSGVGTPIQETPALDLASRIRRLEGSLAADVGQTPKSVALPSDVRPEAPATAEVMEDYFSKPVVHVKEAPKRKSFDFWKEMPQELVVHIFRFLKAKEIVRCSAVSRGWHKMCFDGQLWINLDTEEYYRQIPASSLSRLMSRAGPFVRDLNLRGCAQMPVRWGIEGQNLSDACRNLENFSLEGCRIDKSSIHYFLLRNPRLVQINLTGLKELSNSAMRIIAQGCQYLERLNVSWCRGVDTRGLLRIVQSCTRLRDLRAGEIRGFNDKAILLELFERNTLERLFLSHCLELDDESLRLLIHGENPEIDPLSNRAIVPPRRLRHLDLSRCTNLTSKGIACLAHNVPYLAGLQLSHCEAVTDDAVTGIFESVPLLTHLDLEELNDLTNASLQSLARSPCKSRLQHLNISYCEDLGDTGMLQVVKNCPQLQSLVMDNTRVSDLVLIEAAAQVRAREQATQPLPAQIFPRATLHIVVYDCQNVTWTGVREILNRNTEPSRQEVVSLKCFYGYQDTVNEHMKRVLRGDAQSAARLERKWAEYMIANEEAGAQGAGARRRRRRLREAAMVHADEEEGGPRGGRRRARSGGCAVM